MTTTIGDDVRVFVDDLLYEGRVVFHNPRTDVLIIHPRFLISLMEPLTGRTPYDAQFFITSSTEDVVRC